MADLQVRIERVSPMRVAWARAVGRSPEREAWLRLRAWAEPQGLLEDPEEHPVYGFNNPAPGSGGGDYGYEIWLAVGLEAQPAEGVGLKDFPGGVYAVTSCPLVGGVGVPGA